MWTNSSIPHQNVNYFLIPICFKDIEDDERCICCGSTVALLPLVQSKKKIGYVCALCNKWLLNEGYVKVDFNPSRRNPFVIVQVKDITSIRKM